VILWQSGLLQIGTDHFNHDKEFIWKARGFNSVQEMNEAIIYRHNSRVIDSDDVYVLGDLCLGDLEAGRECISQMRGKLHIVLGNHDTSRRIEMYKSLPNVVEIADALRIDFGKYHFIATHYPMLTGNLEKESLKRMTLNLHGHTHSSSKFYYELPYCYHVGVDAHDCKPVQMEIILEDMKNKVYDLNLVN
jgi:calcineurin-like phosphoesterase family protein